MDSPTRPRLVLVADDYDGAAALVAESLGAAAGFETMVAKDGREALALALQRRPDAAVLDLEMPFVGGIEVARRLRELLGEHRPFLIAVTGGSVDSAMLSGMFDHVLRKPFGIDELLRLLDDL